MVKGGREMEILVNEIVGIEPVFTQPGHPSALRVNLDLSDSQARDVFCTMWSFFGDKELKKWLELEGWEIRTHKSLCDQEDVCSKK
jgi:hypothetical protein